MEQVREMVGHGSPHRQPKQHSMSRLLKLFSTSQDTIYEDNHLDRVSEMLDGMADHETPSCQSRQLSALRLFDLFSTSRVADFQDPLLQRSLLYSDPFSGSTPLYFLLSAVAPRVALCLLAIFHVDNTHMYGYQY